MTEHELPLSMYEGFATLSRGADVDAYVRRFFHPACEYFPVEESEPVRGHDEMIRWNKRWLDVWQAIDVEVTDVTTVGDRVLTEIKLKGQGGTSGLDVSQTFFHLFELRDGKIARMDEYSTRQEALEAADRLPKP